MITPKSLCVPAKTIHQGRFFRKRGGGTAYLRISESSVKFFKLDPAKVYGVSFNGNMCAVDPESLVARQTLADMTRNYEGEREWNARIARRCGECIACYNNQPCLDPP